MEWLFNKLTQRQDTRRGQPTRTHTHTHACAYMHICKRTRALTHTHTEGHALHPQACVQYMHYTHTHTHSHRIHEIVPSEPDLLIRPVNQNYLQRWFANNKTHCVSPLCDWMSLWNPITWPDLWSHWGKHCLENSLCVQLGTCYGKSLHSRELMDNRKYIYVKEISFTFGLIPFIKPVKLSIQ